MEFEDLHPDEVTVLQQLYESKWSVIFHVTVRGVECALKIHRLEDDWDFDHMHQLEVNAYRRLQANGLSEKGYIPKFYGSFGRIQPELWTPNLEDEKLAALLLEYVPGMQSLNLQNYTKERMSKFHAIIEEIHAALVLHEDPYPRNMMIVPNEDPEQERVLWIDFDRAVVFDASSMTEKEKGWIAEETIIVKEMAADIEHDIPGGRIDHSYPHFYPLS